MTPRVAAGWRLSFWLSYSNSPPWRVGVHITHLGSNQTSYVAKIQLCFISIVYLQDQNENVTIVNNVTVRLRKSPNHTWPVLNSILRHTHVRAKQFISSRTRRQRQFPSTGLLLDKETLRLEPKMPKAYLSSERISLALVHVYVQHARDTLPKLRRYPFSVQCICTLAREATSTMV